MEQNINLYVHGILKDHISPTDYCIDATCGNGFDTVFLAQHAAHVFAVDIQQQAIEHTTKLLDEHHLTNVTLVHSSHANLSDIIPKENPIQAIMYNLGYLPKGDHTIVTTPESTLQSLKDAIQLLAPNGLISIILYVGHEGGLEEALAVEAFCKTLDKHEYTIVKSTYLNRRVTPYVILIQKEK